MRPALLLSVSLMTASCGGGAGPAPVAMPNVVATCADTSGDVQVRRAGQAYFEPGGVGSVLLSGNWVKTGRQAFARVEFSGGGRLELEEDAVVVVDVAPAAVDGGPAEAAPLVAVESGEVRGTLAASRAGTPRALIIRSADGTQTRVRAATADAPVEVRLARAGTETAVSVSAGDAVVTPAAGGELALAAGQTARVSGQAPPKLEARFPFPRSLEPGIDARQECGTGQPVRLAWAPVEGAAGYRVEVALDLSFKERVATQDTTDTAFTFSPRRAGVYSWRVASRNEYGRPGEFGFARRVYCESVPPQEGLLSPEDGAVVGYTDDGARVALAWKDLQAPGYRVVVAREPDLLRSAVHDERVTAPGFEVAGLTAGTWHWGVFAVTKDGERPIFLQPRRLVVFKSQGVRTVGAINQWGQETAPRPAPKPAPRKPAPGGAWGQ